MFERIVEVLGSDAPSHLQNMTSFVSGNDSVDSATHRLNLSSLAASPSYHLANDSREASLTLIATS
jgi:hypothetical protein